MNIKKLKEILNQLDDETEIMAWHDGVELQQEVYNFTVDTDMETGKIVVCVCVSDKERGNYRDFEPHPGWEDHNCWLWDNPKG